MIEFERRMPKFEKIPLYTFTDKDKEVLNKLTLGKEKITVNRLRHAKIHLPHTDKIIMNALQKKMKNHQRTKEILANKKIVEECNDYSELFSYLSSLIGNDAISILIKKLRGKNKDLYQDVLNKLATGYNDTFMDNALLILSNEFQYNDIGREILNFLKSNRFREPLDFSSMLMILGQSFNTNYLGVLYSFYIFFKDNFPDKEYFEGPLLAIFDIIN